MSEKAAAKLMLAALACVIVSASFIMVVIPSEWMGWLRIPAVIGAVVVALGAADALRLRP